LIAEAVVGPVVETLGEPGPLRGAGALEAGMAEIGVEGGPAEAGDDRSGAETQI